jgi:hypothetical protein
MAELKMAEIQKIVKETAFGRIAECFADDGEQYGDFEIAVPVEVDGVERWAKVTVVCGQLKDTKSAPAFDPFVAREEWEADKAYKAQLAESKAKAKADKIARSKKKD